MQVFAYTARDKTSQVVKGTVEAGTEKEAVALIRERGLFLTALAPQQHGISFFFIRRQGISFGDIVNFTRQLSIMITAGLQLQEALTLLKTQSANRAVSDMLTRISRQIQAGGNLASALEKYPGQFSRTYLALVKSGESSGRLDTVLVRLADNLEKDQEFRSRVRGALVYPAIILSAMVVVFIILMTVVVPRLNVLYGDFGVEVPLPTRILQMTSEAIINYWYLMLLAIFGMWQIFRRWKSSPAGNHLWDGLTLRLPLLGALQKQIALVEFTRTLGMLVGAGVHILDSLNLLVESFSNVYFRDALHEITKKVEKGFPLGVLFAQYDIFPPILSQMIRVGEESGKMDEALIKLSVYFEHESDNLVKGLTTAIEPAIMIILGVGVGFIVFSIITPIYNLTSQFTL